MTFKYEYEGSCMQCVFVTTVIKCHSLSYDILNANMTLFKMSLL